MFPTLYGISFAYLPILLKGFLEPISTPSFLMQPGQDCRVYTNENHPEWCGFNYGSGSAIWNNTGDCAYLEDFLGSPIGNLYY